MRASDYGAPTIRKRLFVIARCDGRPIVWPEPTHGDPKTDGVKDGRLKPWRTAAEIIDWSLPCPSIFMTREEARAYYKATGIRVNRPLAEATMARIARGVKRYVLDAAEPFIVPVTTSRRPPLQRDQRAAADADDGASRRACAGDAVRDEVAAELDRAPRRRAAAHGDGGA
jgi:site-specific DNA-cytosine methylase